MKKIYTKNDLGKSFSAFAIAMLGGSLILSLIFSPFDDADGNMLDWAYWLMQGLYCLIVGFAAFVYARVSETDFVSATTADGSKFSVWHVLWGFLIDIFLIAAMIPLNHWTMEMLSSLTGQTYGVEMPMQLLPMILVACILPAFAEEFAFRGTIAQCVKNNKSKLSALAVSGALFALIHLNPAQTLHQFVLGAILAMLAFRSGSVWTSVWVHLFNNLAAVALAFVFADETKLEPYYSWMFVVGGVGFAACVFGYVLTTRSAWTNGASTELTDSEGNACGAAKEIWTPADKAYFGISVGLLCIIWLLNLFA